jgi:predicted hotdog family 3-hydroxylacyl-ACP dehydratase
VAVNTGEQLRCDWPVAELVPHAAPMVLLDKITAATNVTLSAEVTIDESSPFFAGEIEIPAWWSIEYLAQGVAALAGLRRHQKGSNIPVGFLTGCRGFRASRSGIPLGTRAVVMVEEVFCLDDSVAIFDCRLESEHFEAEGRLTVYTPAAVPE